MGARLALAAAARLVAWPVNIVSPSAGGRGHFYSTGKRYDRCLTCLGAHYRSRRCLSSGERTGEAWTKALAAGVSARLHVRRGSQRCGWIKLTKFWPCSVIGWSRWLSTWRSVMRRAEVRIQRQPAGALGGATCLEESPRNAAEFGARDQSPSRRFNSVPWSANFFRFDLLSLRRCWSFHWIAGISDK